MSTFTKTVNEETGKPAQKIKTEHYNEDGNITLKETFILTDGNKKPISTETYIDMTTLCRFVCKRKSSFRCR